MQSSWNQPAWGVQASTAYTVPGYPQPLPGTAVAPTATTMSTIPYQVPGYQWPGYTTTPAVPTAAVPAAVPPGWPPQAAAQAPQNPQQQWEQWQQWQQQYTQWQQQYGKDYMAAMQAAGQLPAASTIPTATSIAGVMPTPGAVPGIPTSSAIPGMTLPSAAPSVTGHPPPSVPVSSAPPPPLPTTAPPAATQPSASKRPSESKEESSESRKTKAEVEEAIQGVQSSLSDMAEAEKQFDEQFNNWESQFNSWREENANHPDTDQYQAYEAKWTSWRNQLLQRREQMKKKKDVKLSELAKLQSEKTALEASEAQTAQSSGHVSRTQPNPAIAYSNFSMSAYNQQMSMYSVGQSGASMFPPVPPPVGPPVSLLGDVSSLTSTPSALPTPSPTSALMSASAPSGMQNSLLTAQPPVMSANTFTTQANGSIPSVTSNDSSSISKPSNKSGGIPGLDLIDSNNKNLGTPFAGMHSGPPTVSSQEPMKTPADSKPFDFPQLNKGITHTGWPPMGMPPPGSMGVPPPVGMSGGFASMGVIGPPPGVLGGPPPPGLHPPDFNSSQKHFNQGSNLSQPPPGNAQNDFDFNQLPPKLDVPSDRPDFSNPPPSFNSGSLPNNSESPLNQRPGDINDSGRWRPPNEEDDHSRNSYGAYNNNQGPQGRNSGPPFFNARNSNSFSPRPSWQQGGPGPKQALLPTPCMPPKFNNQGQPDEGFDDQQDADFPEAQWDEGENESWNNEPMQGHPGFKPRLHQPINHQQMQGPPGLLQGPPRPLLGPSGGPMQSQHGPMHGPPGGPMYGPPGGPMHGPPGRSIHGRFGGTPFPPDQMSDDNMDLSHGVPPDFVPSRDDKIPPGPNSGESNKDANLPPEYVPEVVIDYRHRPADLGVPGMFEPESMIDYAHGANDMDAMMKAGALDPLPKSDGKGHGAWGAPLSDRPVPDEHGRHRDRDRRDGPPRDWDGPRDRERDRDDRRDDRYRDDRRDDRRGRDSDRGRDRSRDRDRERRSPVRWKDDDRSRDRDRDRDVRRESRGRDRSRDKKPLPVNESSPNNSKPAVTRFTPTRNFQINDLLCPPGRNTRPQKIIIILRGPPGSGKSYVAKLLKDKEVEMGGSTPRILSIDDYFMVETDKEETDPETGRKVTKKVMEFEYEAGMEESYQDSLIKAFRKTVADGYFPFIIIDSVNSRVSDFEDISGFGKQKGFQVYICDMELNVGECFKKNIHNRSQRDIEAIVKRWEKPPKDEVLLDIRSLLQEASITDVDMEDTISDVLPEESQRTTDDKEVQPVQVQPPSVPTDNEDKPPEDEANNDLKDSVKAKEGEDEPEVTAESDFFSAAIRSKWDDLDSGTNKLDRLDGLSKARTSTTTIKDWLQLPEDYFESRQLSSEGGKKRVRWADLAERYEQEKMRAIGFVVGQTDWSRMMDPTGGQSKLTQTKYI